MYEWKKQIQIIVDEIDKCIKLHNDEALTLRFLSRKLGYSEFYTTRKFKEISGMQFKEYLRHRKLAFALKEVRDSQRSILDIAFDYGFSSHEAFENTKKGIKFYVKNKKVAKSLKKQLKGSGVRNAKILIGKKVVYKNVK